MHPLLLLLWACQGTEEPCTGPACDVTPTCFPVEARPLGEADGVPCLDRTVQREVVGCVTEDTCGEITYVAEGPDGVLYHFASYCWPDDYEGVGPGDDFEDCPG